MKDRALFNDPGVAQLILSSAFKFMKPVKLLRPDRNPMWHAPTKTDCEVNYLFTNKNTI